MEHNQKKIWPYFLCAGITAVAVFFATIFGVAIALRFRQRSSVFTPAENGETPAYLSKVEELVSLLDEKYVDGLDMQRLDDYLSEAAVAATGDRWSYYISAKDFDAYLESNANAYVGIGVTIQQPEEEDSDAAGFTIATVTHNSPAEKAGLLPGDVITAVEGSSALELGMEETKNRVRGEEGTDVTLTILRGGEQKDVTITRATIEV